MINDSLRSIVMKFVFKYECFIFGFQARGNGSYFHIKDRSG